MEVSSLSDNRVNVAIIYYSATGTTYQLAKAIEEGCSQAGAEVRLLKVGELAPEHAIAQNEKWKKHREETAGIAAATLDDLEWADAVIFGTPTRYGTPAAQLRQFIDQTGPLWGAGKLADKVYSAFCSAATTHGGHETTLVTLINTFCHWSGIIVPPGYADAAQFAAGTPYGTTFVSDNGKLDPDEIAQNAGRFQGRRVTEVTQRFKNGSA